MEIDKYENKTTVSHEIVLQNNLNPCGGGGVGGEFNHPQHLKKKKKNKKYIAK